MTKRRIPLQNLHIATPCTADWNKMVGNEAVRFCGECKLNVYNLSSLNQAQAEDLIQKTEGKLCVRYFKRKDGTVIVQDCPVGVQAVKKWVARIATATVSAFLTFWGGLSISNYFNEPLPTLIDRDAISQAVNNPPVPPSNDLLNNASNYTSNEEPQAVMGGVIGSVVDNPLVETPPVVYPRRSESLLRSHAINQVTPEYPSIAKQAHVYGDVEVEVVVGEDGNVISSRALSGHLLLQAATLKAAKQWQFKPILLKGAPIKVQGILTFRFSL